MYIATSGWSEQRPAPICLRIAVALSQARSSNGSLPVAHMLSKVIEVKTHLPLDQGIRHLVLFPMLFPKCRLAYLKNFGVEDEIGFAVRRQKDPLVGVIHRHLDVVDDVEDIQEDLPYKSRGWPSMLVNDVVFELIYYYKCSSSVSVVEGSKLYSSSSASDCGRSCSAQPCSCSVTDRSRRHDEVFLRHRRYAMVLPLHAQLLKQIHPGYRS